MAKKTEGLNDSRRAAIKNFAKVERIADRPHRLTWLVAWSSLVISVVGLCFSGLTLSETTRNNRINHQPRIKSSVVLPTGVRERLQGMAVNTKIKIPMLGRITNDGPTSISDVELDCQVTMGGKVLKNVREKLTAQNKKTSEVTGGTIDPGGEMIIPIPPLETTVGDFLEAMRGNKSFTVCTGVNYRNIDGVQSTKITCRSVHDEPPIVIVN